MEVEMSQDKKTKSTSLLPNTLTNTVDTLSRELSGQDLGVGTYKINYELCNAVAKHNGQGLCIIPCPTGAGKTHASAELCVNILKEFKRRENLTEEEKESRPYNSIDRVVYITPQKEGRDSFRNSIFNIAESQNLSKSELEYIKDNVYVISSNVDAALAFYDKYTQDPNYLKTNMLSDMQAFWDFRKAAHDYLEIKKARDKGYGYISINYMQHAYEDFSKSELNLRATLKSKFNNAYDEFCNGIKKNEEDDNIPDRASFYETATEWHFLEKIYPSIQGRKKKVYCLTDIKYIGVQDTIVDAPITFASSSDPYLENAMFIFDEIDTIKSNILQNIAARSVEPSIENISLIRSICANSDYEDDDNPGFEDVSPNILRLAKTQSDTTQITFNPRKTLDAISKLANKVYLEKELNYHLKLALGSEDSDVFIFSMPGINLVKNSWYTYYRAINKEKALMISSSDKKQVAQKTYSLRYLLSSTRGAAYSIMSSIYDIAFNYASINPKLDTKYSLLPAISTVIVDLNLAVANTDYCHNLANAIYNQGRGNYFNFINGGNSRRSFKKFLNPKSDLSLYAHGLDIYKLEQESHHAEDAIIIPYSLKVSPEAMFAQKAASNKVIGLSATSTIESIKNLDMEYLGSILSDDLYIPYGDVLDKILTQNDKQVEQNKPLYNVTTELLTNNIDNELIAATDLLANKKNGLALKGLIFNECYEESVQRELYRIALYFKNCVKRYMNGSGNANLLFLNRCIKKHELEPASSFDQEVLTNIYRILLQDMDVKDPDEFIAGCRYVKADCWDEEMDFINSLYEKATADNLPFIFTTTTYNTCGVGKNAQPKLSKDIIDQLVNENKMVITNAEFFKAETDYDSIYLEAPTNTLTWSPMDSNTGAIKKENIILGCFEQLELFTRGEQNYNKTSYRIKRLLNHSSIDYVSLPSAKAETTKTLIQAIGRIARTHAKRKEVYICMNEAIVHRADLDNIHHLPMTYESQKVFETLSNAQTVKSEKIKMNRLQQKYANTASSVYSWISSRYLNTFALNRSSSEQVIEEYEGLNEYLLKYPQPTCRDEIDILNEDSQLPITTANAYIKTENEYLDLECLKSNKNERDYIFFSPEDKEDFISMNEEYSIMSIGPTSARLDTLMQVDVIKQYFKDKGYATKMEPSRYHLQPSLFYMYLGRIGEKAFEAICKEYDIEIEELDPEIYEKFDYRIKGTDIFIDVKHWHESMRKDAQQQVEKAVAKANQCGASSVIYINILANESRYHIYDQPDTNHEVYTVPALVDEATCQINTECIQWLKSFINTHR